MNSHNQKNNVMNGKHTYMCSFASSNLTGVLERIGKQAVSTGWFKNVYLYSEDDLSQEFQDKVSFLLKKDIRGFGYWIWKPQIILQTLSQLKEGDVLLYADAGCHLNLGGTNMFKKYIDVVCQSNSGFLVFSSGKRGAKERQYTKGDIFDYFNITTDSYIYNYGQTHATAFFMVKTKHTVDVITRWKNIMINNTKLIDDSPSNKPNAIDFIENRHDQSIFSILMKQEKAVLYPVTQIGSYTFTFMGSYPIWAVRDKGMVPQGKNTPKHPIRFYIRDFVLYIKNKLFNYLGETIL